jgi:hypothetical protein
MRAWTGSALNGYYSNPLAVFRPKGDTKAGYFITPHCDPDCCQAFGGVAAADFGPFATAAEARKWSRTNLVGIN